MLLLAVLMGMLGCCQDDQLVAFDRLTIADVPEGELNFELLNQDGDVEWSCTSIRREPSCQSTVVDGDWQISFGDGTLFTDFQVWEDDELVFEQDLTWTEQEDRSGGPVCGDDLAWVEAIVDLSEL